MRQHLLVRGNHTNNYAEAGINIMKELIFSRVKAYNLIEMVSIVVDTMDLYYKRKLLISFSLSKGRLTIITQTFFVVINKPRPTVDIMHKTKSMKTLEEQKQKVGNIIN